MRGQDHTERNRDAARHTSSSASSHREREAAHDQRIAQEAHALISLFLDIEDAKARRRCLDYVRREAEAAEIAAKA
ncbi:hypothetical protein [Methylorubrum populi]|uniref:Uncharacterized protein n=1 Tax=Methylorubrum populi TaxID=223967 RepID=A0A921E709_9HYPH|nr:hypothetical protein [Methylorubrum populi]